MASSSHLQSNMVQRDFPSPLAFPATVWDYDSFASFSFPDSEYKSWTRQVELLTECTQSKLMKLADDDAIQKIELINLLCRLGVSYHFETEIKGQLNHIFDDLPRILNSKDHDLYTISILFHVLRQYGYKMSCDVFEKFKDEDGKFNEGISNDVRGVLGLYEASFFSVHGEEILDEALSFTRPHLEELLATKPSISPHIAQYIKNALIMPFHKGLPRLEARGFIDFYEKEESPNEILLEFAKLDFNRLQLLYKQELCQLVSWWKESNLAHKLPYVRDRIVECYFWACGTQFKPHYRPSRMIATMYIKLMSLSDDTADRYATVNQIEAFTDAFERLGTGAIEELPDYMKHLYNAFVDLFAKTEDVSKSKEERSYCAYYGKEAFEELLRAYVIEAKWFNDGYIPKFSEYLVNGCATSGYDIIALAFFIGMEAVRMKEFEWLRSNPKIVKAGILIVRLLNDLVGHEEEEMKENCDKRVECAKGVECYMKEYNVSKEKAAEEILKICRNAWKDINEESMRPTTISRPILEVLVNLTRLPEVVYNRDDAYTHSSCLKAKVASLLINPIPM